jgi:lipopolysaccharide/colanic/teichoic acid biosynthesis glycosyltransferase
LFFFLSTEMTDTPVSWPPDRDYSIDPSGAMSEPEAMSVSETTRANIFYGASKGSVQSPSVAAASERFSQDVLRNHKPRVAALGLTVADLLLGAFFAGFAVLTSAFLHVVAIAPVIQTFVVAVGAQIILKSLFGLYPGYLLRREVRLRKSCLAWGGAALAASLYAMTIEIWTMGIASLIAVVLALFLITAVAQIFGRKFAVRVLLDNGFWGRSSEVFGDEGSVDEFTRLMRADPGYGVSLVGAGCGNDLNEPKIAIWVSANFPNNPTLQRLLKSYSEVVILSDVCGLSHNGRCRPVNADHIGVRLTGRDGRSAVPFGKRAFDLLVAIPALIFAAPTIGLAALAIRILDPGPVFFSQEREGLDGRRIHVLKLRTMYCDADTLLQQLLESDPEARKEWETHFKLRNDPRILPFVGRFLRVFSLDELPQIWNIIRGDMSLVGPRPFPIYHLEAMPAEFRRRRASVMPGLTGVWQISDRSNADLEQQIALDSYYIENRSFWLDVSIILRTFSAVLTGKGAY